MDSIALAYWKRPTLAFTVDYGQKPAPAEIQAAKQVSQSIGIEHHIIKVDCSHLGSGDMIGTQALPLAPATDWWPFRNQLLVTLACMKGISLGMGELLVGTVATDGFHKDGTKEFYGHLSKLMEYQEGNIIVSNPAHEMSTTDLIRKSRLPKSILLWAHSCHTSSDPCMKCNGCKKYLFTLQELGID